MTERAMLDFLSTIEKLKCHTRHSWTSSGRQESVSEHCHRLSVMALLLQDTIEGVDMHKVLKLCIIHDFGEALVGDVPVFHKTKADEQAEQAAITRLLAPLDAPLRAECAALFEELSALQTKEAKVCKALDQLEVLLQHNEADLDTWLPLEWDLNLTYGTDESKVDPYLQGLRELLREDALCKMKQAASAPIDTTGEDKLPR